MEEDGLKHRWDHLGLVGIGYRVERCMQERSIQDASEMISNLSEHDTTES